MEPEDIGRLQIPSDPVVHPDGVRVCVVLSRADLQDDRYLRTLWLADGDGIHQLTDGPGDSVPRWSPDGTRLAFLRRGGEGESPAQVAILPLQGGDPEVVTDLPLGVETLEWAPDGGRLVVVAATWAEGWEELDEEERARRPRRITFLPFRFDDVGPLHDRRRHLWLVDPAGVDPARCLTPGDYEEAAPSWSPDGSSVVFLSDRDPRRGLQPGTEVWEVGAEGGELRRVLGRGLWQRVGHRPDGVLHVIGREGVEWPTVSRLFRVEGERLVDLTGHLDRSPVTAGASPPPLRWVGEAAYTGIEDAGRYGIIRVHPDGVVDHLVEGLVAVEGFDVAGAGDVIAYVASRPEHPPELHLEGLGEPYVTDLAPSDLGTVRPERFGVVSDGVEVDAWAYLPERRDPVPLLLIVHGGPAGQYGYRFLDELQVCATAGMGVVVCNPRGSSGRGEDFLQAVVGEGWGVVDLADVRAVVEEALARFPRLDGNRLGIMGGSYGGFLTAWVIGQEQRWSSAVVERALLSLTSFAGTSDIGAHFPAAYTGAEFPDAWDRWWEASPLALAHQVTTPTLVLHSEEDFRCPIEQAEQYFTALLRAGATAEMVRFPGEGHELSRSGAPRHRVERLQAILEWHRRHLGLGG